MIRHETIAANGISIHLTQAGDPGRPVLLVHGFPELAYSWRHQLPALAEAGYHAIAPDMRGYGRTQAPSDPSEYDIHHLSADLLAILDHFGYGQAVFVGHDWGAMIVWHMAQAHKDRVGAVAALSVPFRPRGKNVPTESMRRRFGDDFYIVRFQQRGLADAELGADARATMRRMLAGGASAALPPWITEQDLAFYGDEFARTGFTGGLNWYRNWDHNWATTAHLDGVTVDCPALFITGTNDPTGATVPKDAMLASVPSLRSTHELDAGHWVQQERAEEVNQALLEFLASL